MMMSHRSYACSVVSLDLRILLNILLLIVLTNKMPTKVPEVCLTTVNLNTPAMYNNRAVRAVLSNASGL